MFYPAKKNEMFNAAFTKTLSTKPLATSKFSVHIIFQQFVKKQRKFGLLGEKYLTSIQLRNLAEYTVNTQSSGNCQLFFESIKQYFVKKYSHLLQQALKTAIVHGKVEHVSILLYLISEGKGMLPGQIARAVKLAFDQAQWSIIQRIYEIVPLNLMPFVKASETFPILSYLIENHLSHLDKIKQRIILNDAFKLAIKVGALNSFNLLLEKGAEVNVIENIPFRLLVEPKHREMIKYLFETQIWGYHFNQLDILQRWSSFDHVEIRKLISDKLILLGFFPIDFEEPYYFQNSVKEAIDSGPNRFQTPAGEKIIALQYLQKIKQETHDLESSINSYRLKQCKAHMEEVIKPLFSADYYSRGQYKLIEVDIKSRILDRIAAESDAETSASHIKAFILVNRDILTGKAKGNVSQLKKQASILKQFSDWMQTDEGRVSRIAWRCFDPYSQSSEYPSFLKPQDITLKSKNTYVCSELDPTTKAFTNQNASHIMRTLISLLFLVIENHPEGFDDFLFYLAEILRGNSTLLSDKDQGVCFPGAYSRALNILNHTEYRIQPNLVAIVKEKLSHKIIKAFKDALADCPHPEDKKMLLDAVIGLHTEYQDSALKEERINAVLKGGHHIQLSGEQGYTPEHLQIRADFFHRYLAGIDTRVEPIEEEVYPVVVARNNFLGELKQQDIKTDLYCEQVIEYVIDYGLIELSHYGALPHLLAAYNATIPREEEKHVNVNPYPLLTFDQWLPKLGNNLILAERFRVERTLKHQLFNCVQKTGLDPDLRGNLIDELFYSANQLQKTAKRKRKPDSPEETESDLRNLIFNRKVGRHVLFAQVKIPLSREIQSDLNWALKEEANKAQTLPALKRRRLD